MTYHPDMTAFRSNHNPLKGGYTMLYHMGQTNHCPGCGGTHWLVGRASAECARCDTALPLAEQAYKQMWQPEEKPSWLKLFDRIAFPA